MPDPVSTTTLSGLITGHSGPPPQQEDAWSQHLDAVSALRQKGYRWDEISQYYQGKVQALRQHGYSDHDILQYYGGDPTQDMGGKPSPDSSTPGEPKATGDWWQLAKQGLSESSGAAILGVKPGNVTSKKGDIGGSLAEAIPETIGDLPVAITSAFWGGKGTTAALMRVPGLADTPVPELAGGISGAFSAGAGPEAIKAERDAWMARNPGQSWNALTMLHGIVDPGTVAQKAGTQGLITSGSFGVGEFAGPLLDRIGMKAVSKELIKLGLVSGTYTEGEAMASGKPATLTDLVDGAILLGALHVGGHSVAALRDYRLRLAQVSDRTGVNPVELAKAAQTDMVLRRQLTGRPNPPSRVASSETPVSKPPPHGPNFGGQPYPDHLVIPRVAGHFDEAVQFTLKAEGEPTVIDVNGAKVKWGINQADHPNVDVAKLTRDQAAAIYKREYWDAIGADKLPAEMRLAAFDTAVVEGVPRAKQWLAESGGNVQEFLARRAAWEAKLLRDNPAKYGRAAKAWATRLRDLGANGGHADFVGSDPTEPLTETQKAFLDNEGRPPEEPPQKPPEEGPEPRPEPAPTDMTDDQARAAVRERTASGPEPIDWRAATAKTAGEFYRQMFNPRHPVNQLIDGVLDGKPIDDLENPKFLGRIADSSDQAARFAIVKEGQVGNLRGEQVGRSYYGIIADAGKSKADQDQFQDGYARSRMVISMEDQGKKTGVDLNAARKTVAADERDHPHWPALFDELMGLRNNTLDWLADSSATDPKKAEELKAKTEAMPGYRRMDDGTVGPVPSGRRVSNLIRTAEGSERQFEPMADSFMRDIFLRHAVATRNAEHLAVANLAVEAGEAKVRRIANIDVLSALDKLKDAKIDEDPSGFDDIIASLVKASGGQLGANEVPLLKEGKLYGVTYKDPDVAKMYLGMAPPERNMVMGAIQAATRFQVQMQTRMNPTFGPHIAGWDAMFQTITNPDAQNVLKSFWLGLDGMFRGTSGYKDYIMNGGAESVFEQMSRDAFIKDQMAHGTESGWDRIAHSSGPMDLAGNLLRTPAHLLSGWTRAWTGAISAGRYIQGQETGETPIRSAVAATESKLHRPTYGGAVARGINRVAPYLAARLSSMEKTARSLFIGGETTLGTKYNRVQAWTLAAGLITMPVLAQWFAYKDEEWYKAMPRWQKDNALLIVPPHGDWAPMVIAGPPLLQSMFGAVPRNLMEKFFEHDPDAFKDFGQDVGAGFVPEGVTGLSIFQPIVEHMANFSFFKHQPLANDKVGAAEGYNHYSSGLARNASRFLGGVGHTSPAVIDNYIQSWAGPVGSALVHAVTGTGAPGNGAFPADPPNRWPLMGQYAEMYPGANTQPIIDAWGHLKEIDELHNSMLAAIKSGDMGRLQELVSKDPAAAMLHVPRLQNEAQREFSPQVQGILRTAEAGVDRQNLRLIAEGTQAMRLASQAAEGIWENRHYTAQDKRQLLMQVYTRMQDISERTNEAILRSRGQEVGNNAEPPPNAIRFQEQPGG